MKGVKTWMTTQWNKDDLFYVCSMIEFVARETHNKVKDVVGKMTDEDLVHQLRTAGVNHCLSFEQVCDEWIEEYGITKGIEDNSSRNKYEKASVTTVGREYQELILDVMECRENVIEAIRKVYDSLDYKCCVHEAEMLSERI